MALNKTINYKVKLSSKVNGFGKSELLIRFDISRTNRPQLKTGIFVDRSIFHDGELYAPEGSKLHSDYVKANGRKDTFVSMVQNIVTSTKDAAGRGNRSAINRLDAKGEVSKEWIERVLEYQDKLNLTEATFREFNDVVCETEEQRKRELEIAEANRIALIEAAKAEEQRRNRKTIYQYIEEYCTNEGISEHRTKMYKVFSRLLLRFQLYKQMIEGQTSFVFDYDTIKTEDVEDFREYARREVSIKAKHQKKFAEIEELVNDAIPVEKKTKRGVSDINLRGENYIVELTG